MLVIYILTDTRQNMIETFITASISLAPEQMLETFLNASPIMVYLMVLGLMVIESSFIPFPSEVIIPPAAYLACTSHNIEVWLILVFGTAGAIIGALINYGLSIWIGRPLVYRFADSRLGHICLINRQKVERAEKYFDEHGAVSTFVGRLIPAIRQLISIPAGLARMNLSQFVLYTGLGALVWNGVLAGLGYWLGTMVTPDELNDSITKYSHYLTYIGIGIGVLFILFILYNILKPKAKTEKSELGQ